MQNKRHILHKIENLCKICYNINIGKICLFYINPLVFTPFGV